MSIIHAPAAGMVMAVQEVEGVDEVDGPAVVIVAPEQTADPDVILVSPVQGTLVQIDAAGFAVRPAEQSPPVPSCREVRVRILGEVESKVRHGADPDDEVEAGQELLRWQRRDERDAVAFLVEVVEPEGEVLCEILNGEVYVAEPVLEIMGPLGEELSAVVALAEDGSVTPADPAEASRLTAEGTAPGQRADPADPANPASGNPGQA